jgi:hypothetical protein
VDIIDFAMAPKRVSGYVKSNDRKYGLEVVTRDPKSSAVNGIRCRFCVVFGREEKVGAKRKLTTSVESWTAPFRYDNVEAHLRNQHGDKWREYSQLNNDDAQATFFACHAEPFQNTMMAHYVPESPGERAIVFDIGAGIVDVVISGMMYSEEDETDDDDDSQCCDFKVDAALQKKRSDSLKSKQQAMSIFKKCPATDNDGSISYTATIPKAKAKLFNLAIRYVSCGAWNDCKHH